MVPGCDSVPVVVDEQALVVGRSDDGVDVAWGVLAAELATVDQLSYGRLNVGVRSGWMPEECAAASAAHIFPKRHKHVRETSEITEGIWTNDLFESTASFADFDPCGFGAKPVQKPRPPDLLQRPQGSQAFCEPDRHVQPRRLDRNPGHF